VIHKNELNGCIQCTFYYIHLEHHVSNRKVGYNLPEYTAQYCSQYWAQRRTNALCVWPLTVNDVYQQFTLVRLQCDDHSRQYDTKITINNYDYRTVCTLHGSMITTINLIPTKTLLHYWQRQYITLYIHQLILNN